MADAVTPSAPTDMYSRCGHGNHLRGVPVRHGWAGPACTSRSPAASTTELYPARSSWAPLRTAITCDKSVAEVPISFGLTGRSASR